MSRHRVSRLASAALLLPGASCGVSASSLRDDRQVPRSREGGRGVVHRSLQTCTAADGFTVTSDAFPVMNGCYAEEEVPPNGGGNRLEVIRYSSSDRSAIFDVGSYNPYFGYKWLAIFHIDGTVTGDSRIACQTNEEIGDLTPADSLFTWECDIDGDGTYEVPIATEATLSISCGCDSQGTEPSPSPASITISPVSTPTPVTPVTTTSPASITPSPTVIAATGTPAPTTAPAPITPSPIVIAATGTPVPTTAPSSVTPSPTVTAATATPLTTTIAATETPITSATPTPITPSRTVTIAPLAPGASMTTTPRTPGPTTTSEPTAAATVTGSVDQPATPGLDSVCSNGLAGIEAHEVCCELSCGLCGGVGCGNVPGLTGDQCCVSIIEDTGDLCSMTGAAPCRVDPPEVNPSICPNDLPGVADGDACCAEACNVCGGVNCGTIAGTNGATDCCSGVIIASGVFCDETAAAPCIMTYDGWTSYLGPSGSGSGGVSILTFAPTPAGATAAPTAIDGARGGFFGSVAPTSAPTLIVTTDTRSPTAAPAILSPRGLLTTSPESAGATSAPVLVEEGSETSGVGGGWSIGSSGAGGVVTLAAMVGGVFAVLAAARN